MRTITRVNIQMRSFSEGWILSKFASKLQSNLVNEFGINAHINGDSNFYDVTHHIPYYDAHETNSQINTFLITHVDTIEKERQIKLLLAQLDYGICLSESTSKILRRSLNSKNLMAIIPGIDQKNSRKISLGFASNVYADNRKKTDLLLTELLKLYPDKLKIVIMGSGWEDFVLELRSKKFDITLVPKFNYDYYHNTFWNIIDYFVYPSEDEGSMAFLDACAYGVKTIVTNQGFHRDLAQGITYKLKNVRDLSSIIGKILKKDLRQTRLVDEFTWKSYTKQHLTLWSNLLLLKDKKH